jgi:hypothetical protein
MRFDNSYAFSELFNRAATMSDQYLEITGSDTDHTVLSFITLCLAEKFSFLSPPICPSQSCGPHAPFRRTCFEVGGIWHISLRGGWMRIVWSGYLVIRKLLIIRLRIGAMVSGAEGQCENTSNSNREPERSYTNWCLVPRLRTRQEA